jgi:SAM-dependent methyltransferase
MIYSVSEKGGIHLEDLYNNPKYYEIAFSFRDIKHEVDVFEECFRRYSKISVRRVLELGCGPGPHLEELARRGYEYVGLDVNETMLDYAKKKAEALGITATFVRTDMRFFLFEKPVDFAYVMLGSLYAETTDDLLSHFASVAQVLSPGGLYLLDWCINFGWGDVTTREQSWTEEKEGVKVDVRFVNEGVMDRAAQIRREMALVDVDDNGKKMHLETHEIKRAIFPQEFLLLVEKSGKFEFIGWWNNWNLDEPVEKAKEISRPITIIRRL